MVQNWFFKPIKTKRLSWSNECGVVSKMVKAKNSYQIYRIILLIMDNAPYHNTLSSCSPPTPSCTKEKIWNWLLSNQIPVEKNSLKAELVTVLKKIAPLPVYFIPEIAKK